MLATALPDFTLVQEDTRRAVDLAAGLVRVAD
jgi:hypothetical protein